MIYTIKIKDIYQFIRFCSLYSITIYFTWHVDDLFSSTWFATVTDEPCSKITSEEKHRLITETYSHQIIQTQNLK